MKILMLCVALVPFLSNISVIPSKTSYSNVGVSLWRNFFSGFSSLRCEGKSSQRGLSKWDSITRQVHSSQQRWVDDHRRAKEEKRRLEEEKRRLEEEKLRAEKEKRRAEEERRKKMIWISCAVGGVLFLLIIRGIIAIVQNNRRKKNDVN